MTALAVVVVLAIPVVGLCLLLHLATLIERRREALIARQVALTDAIHGVLGPVVAPIVRRGHGRWVGVLPVPAGHPEIGLMVEIAQMQLGPTAEVVVVDVGGPDMAPHTPRRSSRPGKAVPRLDPV